MDRQPPRKRPRLSMACNICRQRKVKCDAAYPKCRNCRVRNQICITTDPQRPGCPGVREWLEIPEKLPPSSATGVDDQQQSPRREFHETYQSEYPHQKDAQPSRPQVSTAPATIEHKVSPVHQPFDTSFNIEQGTNRMKVMGGSSSQCLAKSLDVYFKTAGMKPVSSFFRYGMRHAEELELPLTLALPDLPEQHARDRYISAYRTRIHPAYPLVRIGKIKPGMEQQAARGGFWSLPREQIPFLVMAYLILSLGADELAQFPTEEGEKYLHAAAGLLSHLIVVPYLPTIQALLLLTLAYRRRNHDGLAWQTLGMAIRIAYTVGIHRPMARPLEHQNSDEQELHARVWATCCCIETVMHLESGRPTTISDEHMAKPQSILPEYRFTRWHLELAGYQASICDHIYNHRSGTRNVRQILLDTAHLDRGLLSWANQIPPELRPGSDIFCAKDEFHIVTFLSIQYHSSMIALHRAALIAPVSTFEAEVTKHRIEEPSRFRIADGESVCMNSARAIAKLSVELPERAAQSCLIPTSSSLLACIVLAIGLMKHPGSRLQAIDLQLLKACLNYSSTQMAQCKTDPRFMGGLDVIYDQAKARIDSFIACDVPQQPSLFQPRQSLADTSQETNSSTPVANSNIKAPSNQLPTPSTYETTTPVNRTDNATNLSQINANGQSEPHPDPIRRDPGNDSLQNIDNSAWEPLSQQHGDIWNMRSTNGFLDGLNDDMNQLDQVFPFENFDVEDLWNWMLYLDSPSNGDTLGE
ncbi:hypothetical protein BDV25DRAFT_135229 [Aspergillus avenaceus]|uniref:Zn(2)-C6 fungal-type domain-containing protein n=1 Tax=Aspergillus avenaceus TaxID=36643 RepID=A0A5N6UAG0_ASPAV|nr:hypothetical protein BDV25DRAFT_135229 [Aspergillus avenaceus]